MLSTTKFLYPIVSVLFLIIGEAVYSLNASPIDPASTNDTVYAKGKPEAVNRQASSANFYKTDSIFSFRSRKGYLPSLGYNLGAQFTAPFRMNSKQWMMTGAAAVITAGLIHFDNEIDEWARVQKQKHNWVNKTSPLVTNFGGPWGIYSAIASGAVFAVFKNEKGVQTSLLATQAMITSGLWANIVKVLTGRERPMADYVISKKGGGEWYGPFAVWDQDLAVRRPVSAFDAFPSGHTATAFSIATVFAMQYKDKKAVPIICYSAATLVGISRLTEHEHWASDVFVGGLLGYLCGRQVVNHYNKLHESQPAQPSSNRKKEKELTLIQRGNQIGVSLRW
jgi:membrane-associated phospholipid phosphatase